MDYTNPEFYLLEPLETLKKSLQESEGITQSMENCKILFGHAVDLKKSIIRIISEIDKCCQKVSNLTLKKQFHEAKGNLLTKSGEFYQLFGEITHVSSDIIIDGELLMSFLSDFEELVQYFKDVLLMHEHIFIELASAHINSVMDILEELLEIKLPDNLEVKFAEFCINVANLSPMLCYLGKNIVGDPRNITIDATYKELKYMSSPLGKSISMSIFHPTNKALKDQKLIISRRVLAILTKLNKTLLISISQPTVSNGQLKYHINEATELLDQFRNSNINQSSSEFLQALKYNIIEVIKHAAAISYNNKRYEECNVMTESKILVQKLTMLSENLAALDSSEPNERDRYFGFCRSFGNLMKRIEMGYANQVFEDYSDPLIVIQDLIGSVTNCSSGSKFIVKESVLQFNLFSSNLYIMGGFAIAKSKPDRAKTLIQLLNTLEWLEDILVSCAFSTDKNKSNLLQLKLYARIWSDCVIKCCFIFDEIIDTDAVIHISGLKFKEICNSLSLITGTSLSEINMAEGRVSRASKLANHLLQIQQVNPFYNGSQKLHFTSALKNLKSAHKYWDNSAMKMLEAINNIELVHGTLQLMDNFDEDTYLTNGSSKRSFKVEDESSIVSDYSSLYNNTSIDISRFLSPAVFRKSLVHSSKKNFSLKMEELDVNLKSVTKRNMSKKLFSVQQQDIDSTC